MAVPDSPTFTFHDVTTEIYGDTANGRNLVDSFTDATGTFDSDHEGIKDRLSNFRNYVHTVVSNILEIGSLSTGSVEPYVSFYIDNLSQTQNITVQFTVTAISGSASFNLYTFPDGDIINVGETFTPTYSVSPDTSYDWTEFPFTADIATAGTATIEMVIISATVDQLPVINSVELSHTFYA